MKKIVLLLSLALLAGCSGDPSNTSKAPYSSSILNADECELLPEKSRNDCLMKQALENSSVGLCKRLSVESEQRTCLLQLEARK